MACLYDSQYKWYKNVYNILNMDILLTKMHWFATGGLYLPPQMALFDYIGTVEQKHPPTPILTLGRARIIFNLTPISFIWKKKVSFEGE